MTRILVLLLVLSTLPGCALLAAGFIGAAWEQQHQQYAYYRWHHRPYYFVRR